MTIIHPLKRRSSREGPAPRAAVPIEEKVIGDFDVDANTCVLSVRTALVELLGLVPILKCQSSSSCSCGSDRPRSCAAAIHGTVVGCGQRHAGHVPVYAA